MSALSRRSTRARWIDSDASPERTSPPHEHEERCQCSLAQFVALPATYADILQRVDVDGASLDEVAKELSITVNNATVCLSRAQRLARAHDRPLRNIQLCAVQHLRRARVLRVPPNRRAVHGAHRSESKDSVDNIEAPLASKASDERLDRVDMTASILCALHCAMVTG